MSPDDPFAPTLQLTLFGAPSCCIAGATEQVDLSRKAIYLLAALALSSRGTLSRAKAANDLWPEADTKNGLFYLRRTLTEIRNKLGSASNLLSPAAADPIVLQLDSVNVDVLSFDGGINSDDLNKVQSAIELYTGHLLAPADDPWIQTERTVRRTSCLRAISRLRDAARSAHEMTRVVELSRLAIKVDPLRESEHRELIEALADSGAVTEAVHAAKQLTTLLARRLHRLPEPETTKLLDRLNHVPWSPRPAERAGSTDQSRVTGSYPSPISSLVGREAEIQHVRSMVLVNRLVTITAAGGFGKTRLATQVASTLESEFNGGIWFCDLDSITNPDLILGLILTLLGSNENAGLSAIQEIRKRLQGIQTLLIFDNCEHLHAACATLAQRLLNSVSGLRILATSRQPLSITGEILFPLSALAVPVGTDRTISKLTLEALKTRYAAVELFITRAQSRGTLTLTDAMAPAICRICSRLEGNAMTIELAAAQASTVGLPDIDRSLGDLFDSLVNDSDVLPDRQRSADALIGWSFNLLSAQEQDVLGRLTVFRGGLTLGTAIDVCTLPGESSAEIRSCILHLADKRLIQTVAGDSGGITYRMLDLVRTYISRHSMSIDAEGVAALRTVEKQFLDNCYEFLEVHYMGIYSSKQAETLNQIEAYIDNLRAALQITIDRQDTVRAIGIFNLIWRFWFTRCWFTEATAWINQILELPGAAAAEGITHAYVFMGNIAHNAEHLDVARTYFTKYLARAIEINDERQIALAQSSLAIATLQSHNYEESKSQFELVLPVLRRLNDKANTGRVLSNLGESYSGLRDYVQAIKAYTECIRILREVDLPYDVMHAQINLANVFVDSGDVANSVKNFMEAFPVAMELRSSADIRDGILVAMLIVSARGHLAMAVQLLGMLATYGYACGLPNSSDYDARSSSLLSAASVSLGDALKEHLEQGYQVDPADIPQVTLQLVSSVN